MPRPKQARSGVNRDATTILVGRHPTRTGSELALPLVP